MQKKLSQSDYNNGGKKFFPLIRETDIRLRSDEYIVIHLDGVKFTSKHLKSLDTSTKRQVFDCLTNAAIDLCKHFNSSRIAYVYGDEVSIIFQGDLVKDNSHNRIQKLCSIASGFLSIDFLNHISKHIKDLPSDFKANCFFAAKTYNLPKDMVTEYFKWRLIGCKKLIFDKRQDFEKSEDWEKFSNLITFDGSVWKAASIDFSNCKLVKSPQSDYFKLKGENL